MAAKNGGLPGIMQAEYCAAGYAALGLNRLSGHTSPLVILAL
jgi:hypothetical protein